MGTWAKGVKSGEGTIEYAGMTYTGGFTDDQVCICILDLLPLLYQFTLSTIFLVLDSGLVSVLIMVLCVPTSLRGRQPLGAGVFKFAAGYQQPGEYVVSTDAGADAAEDEVRPITKWVGQLLATAAT